MNKINEQLKSVVNELLELQDYEAKNDFNTRESKICANIKVYEWLDEKDVVNILNKDYPLLTEAQKETIKQEFDENRLNSIYNHTCENEVSSLKEKYEDSCDLTNCNKIFQVWHRANNKEDRLIKFYLELYPKDKWYIQEYWDKAKKFKTFKKWQNHFIKNDKTDYTEWLKRSKVDKFECWQYGRSGGWFSICDTDEIDYSNIIYYNFGYWLEDLANIDNDKEFNLRIKEEQENKKNLLKNIRLVLKNAQEKIEAIKQIIEDIEQSKKYFKDSLLAELEDEINNFVSEELEDTILNSNCTIEVKDNLIKTSKGVSVELKDFKTNLEQLKPKFIEMKEGEVLKIGVKVGNYFVERATKTKEDVIVKAGCHKFSLNNIISVCG